MNTDEHGLRIPCGWLKTSAMVIIPNATSIKITNIKGD